IGAHRFFCLLGMLVPDCVDRPASRIEIRELLVVVPDRDVMPGRRGAVEWSQPAREGFQERGFPGSVLSENRHSLSPKKLEGDVPDDRSPGGVAGLETPRAQETPPTDASRIEAERDGGGVLGGLLENFHAREPGPAPFRLPGVDAGDVAADVLLLL